MTLFINCCPRGESRTEKLARALLKALGEYEELRLYDEPLHPLGHADIAKRDALLAEKKYDDEMFRYARQFAAADRIVIAAPLWDLSFPAQLKVYLENIYVTGIVTKYSEAGEPSACAAQASSTMSRPAADRSTAALATTTGRPSRRTASAFRPSSSWKPKTSTSWAQTRKRSSTMPSRPAALRKIKLV